MVVALGIGVVAFFATKRRAEPVSALGETSARIVSDPP
jgi:hypothetical protein